MNFEYKGRYPINSKGNIVVNINLSQEDIKFIKKCRENNYMENEDWEVSLVGDIAEALDI